jgi:hypothetical protein
VGEEIYQTRDHMPLIQISTTYATPSLVFTTLARSSLNLLNSAQLGLFGCGGRGFSKFTLF